MNKNTKIIIGAVVGIALFVIIGMVITFIVIFGAVNKERKSITAEEFLSKMQEKGYIVADVASQFEQYEYVKKAYVAAPNDYKYKIEFYELEDNDGAVMFYNINKAIFESKKGNIVNIETTNNFKNGAKYVLKSNEKYNTITRINNTAMYVSIDEENEKEVKELIKELGY